MEEKKWSLEDIKMINVLDTATGQWICTEYCPEGRFDVNTSSILSRLIVIAGQICKSYSSDVIITWEEVTREFNDPEYKGGKYLFGFRELGVDGNTQVLARLNSEIEGYIREIKDLYMIDVSIENGKNYPDDKDIKIVFGTAEVEGLYDLDALVLEYLKQSDAYKESDGQYFDDLFFNYDDKLSEKEIAEIIQCTIPSEPFTDMILDRYLDSIFELEDNRCDNFRTWLIDNKGISERLTDRWEENMSLRDALMEKYYVNVDFDHFLKQEVKVNIMLDTGDANCDFTANVFLPHYDGYDGDEIPSESSILWLVEQQGYTRKMLDKARGDMEMIEGEGFLSSVVDELNNCSSDTNTLTFLVRMTLDELLDLKTAINEEKEINKSQVLSERKGTGYITLSKDIMCGLYDPWNGGGSTLDIALDKDVIVPLKAIFSLQVDGSEPYDVGHVWGMCGSAWRKDIYLGLDKGKGE